MTVNKETIRKRRNAAKNATRKRVHDEGNADDTVILAVKLPRGLHKEFKKAAQQDVIGAMNPIVRVLIEKWMRGDVEI